MLFFGLACAISFAASPGGGLCTNSGHFLSDQRTHPVGDHILCARTRGVPCIAVTEKQALRFEPAP